MPTDKLLDYLMQHTDKRFDEINSRISDLDSKITTLLEFKWQIIGGSILLSAAASLAIVYIAR